MPFWLWISNHHWHRDDRQESCGKHRHNQIVHKPLERVCLAKLHKEFGIGCFRIGKKGEQESRVVSERAVWSSWLISREGFQ